MDENKVSVVKISSRRQNRQGKSKAIHLVTFRLECVLKIGQEGDGREQSRAADRSVSVPYSQHEWRGPVSPSLEIHV